MAINVDGIFHLVLMGLTEHVFGHIVITSNFLCLLLIIIGMLIQIPVPFAVAIPIPFVVVLTAYGYLTVATGGIMIGVFFVLAIASFLGGLGIAN